MLRAFILVVLFGFLVALGGALGALWAWRDLHTPVAVGPAGVTVTVPAGSSFRAVAGQLQRAGLLRHPRLFTWWARYRGLDQRVRAGEYRVERALSPVELLDLLLAPGQAVRWLTMPEGYTAAQLADLLEQRGFGGRDVFRCAMSDPELLLDLELPATGVEGYLFPDTYAFTWEMEPEAILRAMVARFRQQAAALRERREAAAMSEAAMVILASIIEKETGRGEERPMISGVFRNRLRIGMPLQSDPTVIYGLAGFDGNLARADLADPSPYNTYAHRGLPPGPIANPGAAALEAALEPAATSALYFVSRNDGSHQFSASLAEHNRAVRQFQRRRK